MPFVTFSLPRREKLSFKTEEKLVRREAAYPFLCVWELQAGTGLPSLLLPAPFTGNFTRRLFILIPASRESPGLYRAAGLRLWKNVTFLLLDLCVHLYCLICVLYSFCLLDFPELKQSVFFHICTFGFIPFMPEKCLRMFLVDTLAIFNFQNFFFHLQSQYFIAQSLLFFFFNPHFLDCWELIGIFAINLWSTVANRLSIFHHLRLVTPK